MAYENLCLYCFKEMGASSICPHCGKDARAAVPQIQMLPGSTVYHDRFLLGRALGQDSGGIVYNALDTKNGGTIRIREYLPRSCAERLNDGSVVPIAGMEDAFESGMRKLRASVDSVEDPRKRHFYFEENGTAYIAQRKNNGGVPAKHYIDDDDEEDAADHRRQITIYIAIGAAIVLAVAIGLIWLLNSVGNADDVTLDTPLSTTSPGATWMPAETPTPTPYATATFAALVDPELSWMDYTYSGNVNQDYQQQLEASSTKKPTIEAEKDYNTVNSSSSSDSVRSLQEKLVQLGWMNYTQISGKYDSNTKSAVKDFQRYVNEHCSPAKKLDVDGIAGKKTQQWLYNSSVSLVKPTPTPTPLVTPKPGDNAIVDQNSSRDAVRSLQNKLIALGLLPEGSADGVFGSSTATAIKNFQIRVNQILNYQALEVNGIANADTIAYLNYYVEWWKNEQLATVKPTATIKPAATATAKPAQTQTPDGSVNQNSSKAEIKAMQEKLMQVGLLDARGVDGVYGSGTIAALKNFQNWVNELRGEETLKVNGQCDALTMAYLDYCIENGRVVISPTQAPTQAPEIPTAEPTQEVYEPAAGEGEGDGSGATIDASSPKDSISYVQEMLAEIGLMDASGIDGNYGQNTKDAIRRLQQYVNDMQGENTLEVTGICDAETLQYLMYAYDRGWNLVDQGDQDDQGEGDLPAETAAPEADDPEPEAPIAGGVYPDSSAAEIASMQNMLAGVGLMDLDDVDGDYGRKTSEAIRQLQQFVNDMQGENTLEITGECDPITLQYLQYCFENGWNLVDQGDAEDETEAAPDPTAQPDPAVGAISSFSVTVDGMESTGGLIELEAGEFKVKWSAEGDVDSYSIYLYDGGGNLINSMEGTGKTSLSLNTKSMNPNEIYELRIGAMPAGGTQEDMIWHTAHLTLPVQATPEPTATPEITAEPTARPEVSAPSISIGSSVYQSGGVTYINDRTAIFSWMADGDVQSYTVNLMYEDGTSYSLGTTESTSKTVNVDQLLPGLYKLYVGATPIGGGDDDTIWSEILFGVPAPEPTQAPEPDPTEAPALDAEPDAAIRYIDAQSDPEDIQTVQMALYKYGLLNSDGVEAGVLDLGTLEAVAQFQQRLNEVIGLNLPVLNPETDQFIDPETLDYLLYQTLDFGF